MSFITNTVSAVGGLAVALGALVLQDASVPDTIVVECGTVTTTAEDSGVTVTTLTDCRAGDIPVTINPQSGTPE